MSKSEGIKTFRAAVEKLFGLNGVEANPSEGRSMLFTASSVYKDALATKLLGLTTRDGFHTNADFNVHLMQTKRALQHLMNVESFEFLESVKHHHKLLEELLDWAQVCFYINWQLNTHLFVNT